MKYNFFNFFNLFDKKKKFLFFFLICLIFFGSLLESLGIASVAPIKSIILENNDSLTSNFFIEKTSNLINLSNINKQNIILVFIILFITFFVFKNLYLFIIKYFTENFLFNLRHQLSLLIFKNIMFRNYSDLIKKNSSYYITIIINVVSELVNNVYLSFIFLIKELLLLFFISTFLILYDAKMTILMMLSFTLVSLIFYFFSKKKLANWSKKKIDHDDMQIRSLNEAFALFKFLKISKSEKTLLEKFALNNLKSNNLSKKVVILNFSPTLLFETLIVIFLGLYLIYLSNTETKNLIEKIPLLGVMILAFIRLRPSAGQILQSFNNLRYGREYLNQYIQNLTIPSNQLEFKNYSFKKSLEMRNINFSYGSRKIFSNFDFSIKKGEIIGLQGITGSGKTTLVELILGLQKINNGKIYLDNNDIQGEELFNLIRVGYVTQDIFLMDDTFENNLTFNNKKNIKKLKEIISHCELDDFISSLDQGVNSSIKENGKNISGGQKQRIGLARALYQNPDLLILDEATNALDATTQDKIYKNIKSLGITSIVISHQKESLIYCDKVINLSS